MHTNISYKVALGGIISSLCLLCMFLTGVFPVLYITLPMIAGILMMIMSVEISPSWAYLTFAATGLLAMFVTFDKEAALLYILLFGHYPVTKQFIEKIRLKLPKLILKLVIFNASILSQVWITVNLFGLTEYYEDLQENGRIYAAGTLLLVNLICLTYDYSLNGMLIIYNQKLRPRLLRGR